MKSLRWRGFVKFRAATDRLRLPVKSQTGKSRELIFQKTSKQRYFKNLLLHLRQCL